MKTHVELHFQPALPAAWLEEQQDVQSRHMLLPGLWFCCHRSGTNILANSEAILSHGGLPAGHQPLQAKNPHKGYVEQVGPDVLHTTVCNRDPQMHLHSVFWGCLA
jgi:hypothetical protein